MLTIFDIVAIKNELLADATRADGQEPMFWDPDDDDPTLARGFVDLDGERKAVLYRTTVDGHATYRAADLDDDYEDHEEAKFFTDIDMRDVPGFA